MAAKEPAGSFIRWQSITIEQLTYSVNLILGLSVAALGFQIHLLLDSTFQPASWQKSFFLLSMFSLLLSIALGLWCIFNRLVDFRTTAKAARLRERDESDSELAELRGRYKRLGQATWRLFCGQVATFGIGILLVVIAVLPSLLPCAPSA
ncbi:MAG: hypothetical protein ACFCUQ_02510 [Kiloniellales bacterium]